MKKFLVLILLIGLGAFIWIERDAVRSYLEGGADLRTTVQNLAAEATGRLAEIRKDVSTPPPLRGPDSTSGKKSPLTVAGVLEWTNKHRAEAGLSPLTLNAELNTAAQLKVDDMFAHQYFEHASPTGEGPSDLAEKAGYGFVAIGENLAVGNFANDEELVQAWMDSPGHRANILAENYTEIGIAAARGTFEGDKTWLAVQEFGKPLSACPQPSTGLKAEIAANEARIEVLTSEADRLRAELDARRKPRTQEEVDAYNAKADEYNAIVSELNELIGRTQARVDGYNAQVQAFNTCAGA